MIQGNIALYKPTDQILVYQSSYSSYAVDGGTQTYYQVCVHSEHRKDPWWRVDLERVEDVAEVHILGRDSYANNMDDAEIRVGQ